MNEKFLVARGAGFPGSPIVGKLMDHIRSGIFTFLQDHVMEFNLLCTKAGKIMGNHYPPEVDEYFQFTSGEDVRVTKDTFDAKEEFSFTSAKNSLSCTKNTRHVYSGINDSTAVALLTKIHNDCNSHTRGRSKLLLI